MLFIISNIVLGDAHFNPTSKMAATKSRCKSSGQTNRFLALLLLLLLLLSLVTEAVSEAPRWW